MQARGQADRGKTFRTLGCAGNRCQAPRHCSIFRGYEFDSANIPPVLPLARINFELHRASDADHRLVLPELRSRLQFASTDSNEALRARQRIDTSER